MRPAILPPTIVTTMKFLITKFLKCLQAMEDVEIDLLRLATITLVTTEVIIVVMLVKVDVGYKRPNTLPLSIVDKELMLKGELDIGLIPDTLPPITQVIVVYFYFISLFSSC